MEKFQTRGFTFMRMLRTFEGSETDLFSKDLFLPPGETLPNHGLHFFAYAAYF